MSKKAIAYVSDIILGRTGEVISKAYQKQEIENYAKEKGIEIVKWFEDDVYNEDVISRPAVQDILSFEQEYDIILVERIWAFSRRWQTLASLFAELDRRGVKVECATLMWDCVSQMARRRYMDSSCKNIKPRELVTRDEVPAVRIRKPEKIHFANLATKEAGNK
ncbi:MAG: recombinase family protein [Deltaproteobacteria bacterium]|nr:recombinase family protein [Deltaproteobacteria bacterium]